MQIRLFSDVHLEFGACAFPAGGDVVVAAGDIAPGTAGLEWLGQSSLPVIYVAGNHEYYGGDLVETRRAIEQQAARYSNLYFLECSGLVLDGVRFLGATLWTGFNGLTRVEREAIREQMNDFEYISKDGRKLKVEDVMDLHRHSMDWLCGELERDFPGRTVVVTHHAPSMRSWHREQDDITRHAYCNALEELVQRFPIELWIHGHTHTLLDYRMHNTRVLCNARGYYLRETLNHAPADCLAVV